MLICAEIRPDVLLYAIDTKVDSFLRHRLALPEQLGRDTPERLLVAAVGEQTVHVYEEAVPIGRAAQ